MRIPPLISLAITAASLLVAWEGMRESHASPNEPIKTQKDPSIVASEQYAFVECKRRSGEYKRYHHEDMIEVLKAYGIPVSILQTQKVKETASRQIKSGGCDFYSGIDRIKDIVGNIQHSESVYHKLSDWQLYTVNMYAEAECKISTGELSSRQEQEKLVEKRLSKGEGLFEGVGVDQFTDFVKGNISTMAWLTLQKKTKGDCTYRPSIRAK